MPTDEKGMYEKICEIACINDIGDLSDEYHQRVILWATIVNRNKERAWKTRKHEDGQPCFGGGWFLVAVDTPKGPYGYHYEDKYWDMFDCKEIEVAKPWGGYTEEDSQYKRFVVT